MNGLIERIVMIETAAHVYGGLSEALPLKSSWSTWRIQQMRRAAKLRAKLPWRDVQIEAQIALDWTGAVLCARGAIQGE